MCFFFWTPPAKLSMTGMRGSLLFLNHKAKFSFRPTETLFYFRDNHFYNARTYFFWYSFWIIFLPLCFFIILFTLLNSWLYFYGAKFLNKQKGLLYNFLIPPFITFGTKNSASLHPWLVICSVILSTVLSTLFPKVFITLRAFLLDTQH